MILRSAVFLAVLLLYASQSFSQENEGAGLDQVETPEEVVLEMEGRYYTPSEVKILQDLEMQRIVLDRKEKALDLRERLIDLSEKRLAEKSDQMEELKIDLKRLLGNLSDKEEEELMSLVTIYEAMKPAAAATVIDRLDNKIVFDIFKRMNRKKTAKIMEKLSAGKARIISEMLAEKSDLPLFE